MERSMNSRMAIRIAIALLVGLLSCTTGMARQKNAPAIVDGMHLVPDTNQSKPFHVTAADMRRIKPEVAALFREIFARELAFAGDMTLYLELRDPITGDLLAKALDRQLEFLQAKLEELDGCQRVLRMESETAERSLRLICRPA